ncbi:DUF6993 domain-containing protein [Microbacterium sp. NPDC057659]|uniref:DUF6993 domain-containing protein n=1 Tax=Microbacterium sp. NPDC057659 TaxID=3346198 RepID=UPI00366DE567
MHRRSSAFARRRLGAITLSAGLLLTTACAPDPVPTPSDSEPVTSPTPRSTATPTAPALHADGTAADNLPLFAEVTARVWSSGRRAEGRAYVDALVAAGFPRDRMQVTADETTVGNPVESLQFSVAWGDAECLVGQVGPSTGAPVTAVLPQLAEGRCLVGETRPIDW